MWSLWSFWISHSLLSRKQTLLSIVFLNITVGYKSSKWYFLGCWTIKSRFIWLHIGVRISWTQFFVKPIHNLWVVLNLCRFLPLCRIIYTCVLRWLIFKKHRIKNAWISGFFFEKFDRSVNVLYILTHFFRYFHNFILERLLIDILNIDIMHIIK